MASLRDNATKWVGQHFIEVHSGEHGFVGFAPILPRLRRQLEAVGGRLVVWTLLRNPIDHAVSTYNYMYALPPNATPIIARIPSSDEPGVALTRALYRNAQVQTGTSGLTHRRAHDHWPHNARAQHAMHVSVQRVARLAWGTGGRASRVCGNVEVGP